METQHLAAPPDGARLLKVRQVADMANLSVRTVQRLEAAGAMPRSIRLGSAVRWQRSAIEEWLAAGCPSAAKEVSS